MRNYQQFYIDGQWVDPLVLETAELIDPATEAVSGSIALGSPADVDRAVAAARRAFASWSQTTVAQRLVCCVQFRPSTRAVSRNWEKP